MTNTKFYSETNLEKTAKELDEANKIAKLISDVRLSQRQLLYVMYKLALELENNEQMTELTTTIRSYGVLLMDDKG